jgi:hypothetical protein
VTELATPEDQRTAASRVGAVVELQSIRLLASACNLLNDPIPGQVISQLDVRAGTSIEGNVLVVRTGYFATAMQRDEAGGEMAAWTASCEWLLDYTFPNVGDVDPSDAESFALVSSVFSTHPYARAYFQRVTGEMGYPPLILGVMKSPVDEIHTQVREGAPA